jgi:hypothetical protein
MLEDTGMSAAFRFTFLLATRGLLCLPLLAGCAGGGPTKYSVTGKLTNGGKPLEFDPTFGTVQLTFVPMKGDRRPPASVLPDEEMQDGGAPAPPEGGATGDEFVEVYPAQVTPTGE